MTPPRAHAGPASVDGGGADLAADLDRPAAERRAARAEPTEGQITPSECSALRTTTSRSTTALSAA